jgi:L-ascorbate metabolism protein UlaG (beta-lactamase superfamily)
VTVTPGGSGLEITFVGNAGFLVAVGEKKILIDALYRGFAGDWMSKDTRGAIRNAQPPFDNLDLILTTHSHSDHFDASIVMQHLQNDPTALFVSTDDTASKLSKQSGFEAVQDRIIAVQIEEGERKQLTLKGIEIEALNIPHGANVVPNLGFVITVEGNRLFHTGDISPDHAPLPYLQAYQLPDKQIDVAFVPWFLLTMSEYQPLVREGMPARYIIPMHFTGEGNVKTIFDKIDDHFPDAVLFDEEMQTWEMPRSAAAPPSTSARLSLVDSGQRLGAARSWDVSLGDLDGDGDLDAFVVNDMRGDVSNAVWLNDGRGVFAIREQSLGHGMNVALGDLDRDGDLDAFVVSWDEAGKVWFNDGTGSFADSGQSLGSPGGWDIALGDVDDDGDLDAFVANAKANTVWSNDGGVFTDTGQRLGTTYSAGVGLGDLDGDGDLDALTTGWGEPGKVWLNDGAGTFTDSGQALSPSYIHMHGMGLGDVDGDGDLDSFLAGAPCQLWLNDGAGTFSESEQNLRSRAGDTVAFGDLDGDGDLDVYLAVGDRSVSDDKVWLNEGDGRFTDSGLPLSDTFSSGIGLGDLDGDGDLDAFVVHGELGRDKGGGVPNEVWLNETP